MHHHFPALASISFFTYDFTCLALHRKEEYNISWIWILLKLFSFSFSFFVSTAWRKMLFVWNAAKWERKKKHRQLRAQHTNKKPTTIKKPRALSSRINNKNCFWYKTVCTARPIDSRTTSAVTKRFFQF